MLSFHLYCTTLHSFINENNKNRIDNYRKMQKALITTDNGKRLVLQH